MILKPKAQDTMLLRGGQNILGVIIVILSGWLLVGNLNEPFWGHHEFNGVFYGQIARNYHRYGLSDTKLGQVTNTVDVPTKNWHTHHPSTYPLMLALWFGIFGESEASARSLSIVASVLMVWGAVKLVKLEFGRVEGLLPILLTPMYLYYGRLPVFEPFLMAMMIWGLYFYRQNREKVWLGLYLVMGLFDWPGFWWGVWVAIVSVREKKWQKRMVKILAVAVVAFGVFVLHQAMVSDKFIDELIGVFGFRISSNEQPFSAWEWIRLLISRVRAFFGLSVLILAGIGVLMGWRTRRELRKLLVICVGVGVTHILVFRNIFWYHDYMLYYLIPLLIVGLGVVARKIYQFLPRYYLWFWLGVSTLMWQETKQFSLDLMALAPHRGCVEAGQKIAESKEREVIELTVENSQICPPFIGYYGQKEYGVELVE